MKEVIRFSSLPTSEAELKLFPEFAMDTPFKTAALAVAVLCNYENDVQSTIGMVNLLKGPQPLSAYEEQFLRDRLRGKQYVTRSYFEGSNPENGYIPSVPYSIEIEDNPYSYTQEGYASLYLRSSGADSPRSLKLRKKGNQWFLWEIQCLSDIRQPAESDPWA